MNYLQDAQEDRDYEEAAQDNDMARSVLLIARIEFITVTVHLYLHLHLHVRT